MGIGLTRQERRRLRIGVLFALPWIVGFLSFTVFPVVYSFYYSLNVFTTSRAALALGRTKQLHQVGE